MRDQEFEAVFRRYLGLGQGHQFRLGRARALLEDLDRLERALRCTSAFLLGSPFEGHRWVVGSTIVVLEAALDHREDQEHLHPPIETVAWTPGAAATDDEVARLRALVDERTARGRAGVGRIIRLMVRVRRLRHAARVARQNLLARERGTTPAEDAGELIELIEAALTPTARGEAQNAREILAGLAPWQQR